MRIGLIGCGRIANEAHADAYRLAGARVSAVCDLVPARAAAMADRLGAAVAPDAVTLARRADVDLLDVATPPQGRAELLRSLYPHGKPILCQKPLAYDLPTAAALVADAARAGVVLAVNHNARWAPTHQAVYRHLLAGDLGEVYAIAHHNRFNENVDTWYTRHRDYLFLDHGIHYFDLIRVLTGDTPTAVATTAATATGHRPAGPTVHATQMRFADPAVPHVVLTFVNAVPAPAGFDYRLVLDGTRGSVTATLATTGYLAHSLDPTGPGPGAAADFVIGGPTPVAGGWVPDGFAGALSALIRHVRDGGPLPHHGADHLASLAVAVAAAHSARHDGAWSAVTVPDITAPRVGAAPAAEVAGVPDLRDHLL